MGGDGIRPVGEDRRLYRVPVEQAPPERGVTKGGEERNGIVPDGGRELRLVHAGGREADLSQRKEGVQVDRVADQHAPCLRPDRGQGPDVVLSARQAQAKTPRPRGVPRDSGVDLLHMDPRVCVPPAEHADPTPQGADP